ncbi:vasoactive intestinal polypeptide receptor-like isoform X1 [Gadus chalcogrammus]|uniref:vasoactive intestinal polypeptide receptor-like isoform X1 n=1 Tax=Gadus chalcogrammus TaxID=1042646 RepID=UPI0024C4DE82|nr:vasoactive intestinal polypeptide receptor-like isoform X1 [Gadus chalcogrammus]
MTISLAGLLLLKVNHTWKRRRTARTVSGLHSEHRNVQRTRASDSTSSACSVCEIKAEIERDREYCLGQIENKTTGCSGMWDKLMCWPSAGLEEVVTLPCPKYFSYFTSHPRIGNLSKTCTEDGWSTISPASYNLHCGFDSNNTMDAEAVDLGHFYMAVKVGYTIGHSVSLIALTAAIILLCLFRKLHCTRNYIHMNLFVSFVLKATSVFVKDVILYPGDQPEECPSSSLSLPKVGCKAVLVFFQYGIMASYFWLLVEGLYLYALLAVSFFSEKKYFWCYILIGWGVPAIFISAWVGTKVYLKDPGCWDIIEGLPWWIIKTPILIAILVNFFLFICIIRILQQKINCPDIGRKESNQYSRLAKSTLLLIPLFGMNYIIFAYIPEHIQLHVRMVFDLVLGSFQGFIVAVLYCFLNGEVQSEVRRKWRRWMLQRFLSTADTKYQPPSMGSNGNNFSTQITMLTKCSPTTRRSSSCQDHLSAL